MELARFLRPELVSIVTDEMSRDDLLRRFSEDAAPLLAEISAKRLLEVLLEREKQSPTSTHEGVAFPHALADEIDETLVAMIRVENGVDFGGEDHPPSDLVFCMFGSAKQPWEHVRLLARLARIVHTPEARKRLRSAAQSEALFNQLLEEDRSHA